MKRKYIQLLLLLMSVGVLLMGCGKVKAADISNSGSVAVTNTDSKKLKTLTLGLASDTNDLSGILGIAQDKKYLDEELAAVGYKLEVKGFAQAGPAVNEAFVAGDIDIAYYGDLPAVVLKSKGIGVSVVGIGDAQSNLSVIVPQNSNIKTPKDFEGKKVIVGIGTVLEQYWNRIVDEYGIDRSKVEIINDPANALTTYASGNADALVYTDLMLSKVNTKAPSTVIASTKKDHPQWGYQGVIVARNEFSKAHTDVVIAFFKAYIRAYNDAVVDKNLFLQSFVTDGVTIADATVAYEGIDISTYDGDVVQENIDKLNELNSFLFNNKLTSTSVDIKTLADNSFYNKAKEAIGK